MRRKLRRYKITYSKEKEMKDTKYVGTYCHHCKHKTTMQILDETVRGLKHDVLLLCTECNQQSTMKLFDIQTQMEKFLIKEARHEIHEDEKSARRIL